MSAKFTPGPWKLQRDPPGITTGLRGGEDFNKELARLYTGNSENMANARLIAAAPDMYEALKLHKAWSENENVGPNYHGMSRDTHPDGEAIWRNWWYYNLDVCDRANRATDAALAKAEGKP